jgi:signal transduction histidine kinase
MQLKNLNDIKYKIGQTITFAFLVVTFLSCIIIYWVQDTLNKKHDLLNQQQLLAKIEIYQANLAEKLGIIASSDIFLDYLRSGATTRKHLLPDFLGQLHTIRDKSIIGMRIVDSVDKPVFEHGEKTNNYVDLKLCYLDRALNNEMGYCGHVWRIYFLERQLINNIAAISQKIQRCESCEPAKFITDNHFGRFTIAGSSMQPLKIRHNEEAKNIYYTFLPIILFLLVMFTVWTRYRIGYMVFHYLANPLQKLTAELKESRSLAVEPTYLEEINYLISQINNWQQAFSELESKKAAVRIGEIAAQVAHDINSPLAVLRTILKTLTRIPEEQRLLAREAVSRLNDIANNLLTEYKLARESNHGLKPEPLYLLVDEILSEKKIQFADKPIKFNYNLEKAQHIFVKVNAAEFRRILSNIINNAAQAINNNGIITITIYKKAQTAILAVSDNGCGIPPDKISLIRQKGVSLADGTGLGLGNACSVIEEWQGEIQIKSQLKIGTEIQVKLPLVAAPSWLATAINLIIEQTIIVLDDDKSIHKLWELRFAKGQKIIHFTTANDFIEWFASKNNALYLYLIDYELIGEALTGLDFIIQTGIQKQSLLVTSHYAEEALQAVCIAQGIKIIPKRAAHSISINYLVPQPTKPSYELVLIDDDETLTKAWLMSAKITGKKILTFNRIEDLQAKLGELDMSLPIYIDSDLRAHIRGEEFARDLYQQGFHEIYLTTGNSLITLNDKPWLRGIVGKEPPFSREI